MEVQFTKSTCACLDTAVREVRNTELTQEIRLSDGMPDIGHILCAWGQPILRGKEWLGDSVSFSGGMMVWVLYAPEDGSREQCIEGWIPFQMNWDLPENSREGRLRLRCLPRFVDARSISARKILVRAGVAAMAEAFVPMEAELFAPETPVQEAELLSSRYPIRMPVEAGEKTFLMDEDLELPGSMEKPEAVICFRLSPRLAEKRVLGNKLVFRGSGNLHLLYRCSQGRLHSWDFELPFSQFAELDAEHGPDAQGDLILSPTSLELERNEDGRLRFKGGLTGQYLITDKQLLEVIEDAYSPDREVQPQMRTLEVPAVLENRRENLYGEQTIPADAAQIVDVQFQPDFPRQRSRENGVDMELPGSFQVLYYGTDGSLRSGTARWEGQLFVPADENSRILAAPLGAESVQAMPGAGQIQMNAELPLELTAAARQSIPMVTGLELGQPRKPDPGRPSLILRRAGDARLWDIAKASGSTVDAIRRINSIQEEPAPGQMLLIPVS